MNKVPSSKVVKSPTHQYIKNILKSHYKALAAYLFTRSDDGMWLLDYTYCGFKENYRNNRHKEENIKSCSVSDISRFEINPLNAELNPICYLLALLGAHHFLHVSRIRVKSLTLRQLMLCIYGAPILDVSRSHTTTHHSR